MIASVTIPCPVSSQTFMRVDTPICMQVLRSVPEQGQLAVVRQRRYVVTDVRTGVSGAQIAEHPQHLVSLTSIEDDGKACRTDDGVGMDRTRYAGGPGAADRTGSV
jgi:hypothetical protein